MKSRLVRKLLAGALGLALVPTVASMASAVGASSPADKVGFRGSDVDGFYGPNTHNILEHIQVGGGGCYWDATKA
jgi:hypothetical protein